MSTSAARSRSRAHVREGAIADLSADEVRLVRSIPQVTHVQRMHHERNGRQISTVEQNARASTSLIVHVAWNAITVTNGEQQ